MSLPPKDDDKIDRSKIDLDDAMESSKCAVCGGALEGSGLHGMCQICLLTQPERGHWDPKQPPTRETVAAALPRYTIQKEVGRGALGSVFGAVDRQLGRTVAIKVMVASPDNPEFEARFAREAKAMAKLKHPNIVAIYDFGSVGNLYYLVMEYIAGGTLARELAKNKTLSRRRVTKILGDVCHGLQHAHKEGVIHRDVKPGNILIDSDGTAKLSDFGLVKGLLPEEFVEVALTKTNMTMGTPFYMAPEQVEWPASADHRADIYSVGAVYYEMVIGEPPKPRREKDSDFPGVPKSIEPILNRALNSNPDNRYQTPTEFLNDVLTRREAVRRRWIWLGAVSSLAFAALAGAFMSKIGMEPKLDYKTEASEKAMKGLPLGSFDSEMRLRDWFKLADYDFDSGLKDKEKQQAPIELVEGAVIENGMLRLAEFGQAGTVVLKRGSTSPPKGLALNFKFKAEAYLAVGEQSMSIVTFARHWTSGVFLVSSKWGDPRPTFMFSKYQPIAPPGVFEPKLTVNEWHEIWLLIADDYRLWIDNVPVYRTAPCDALNGWEIWGSEPNVDLRFEGFRGLVDHVTIWEKR